MGEFRHLSHQVGHRVAARDDTGPRSPFRAFRILASTKRESILGQDPSLENRWATLSPFIPPGRHGLMPGSKPTTSSKRPLLLATCPAGFGGGGLGQHLVQVAQDAQADGFDVQPICQHGIEDARFVVDSRWENTLFRFPPFRFRPELRVWLRHVVFDRGAARRLEPCDTVTAFMGGALSTFERARALGARKLVLEMPNSHPANVQRLHRLAIQRHPIERSWMGDAFCRRVERELRMADEVRANSDYTAATAVSMGVDPAKIVRRRLVTDPRFGRIVRQPHPEGARTMVLVGSLTVFKGVPFLVDLFRDLPGADLRLVLFGGWSSSGMRRYLEAARKSDPRISWDSGDPAKVLSTASLAVHPSWEDGWGYAPAEALAAGLPVLVSDQTGMKEILVDQPGAVLPAGDTDAWRLRLERWARGESA